MGPLALPIRFAGSHDTKLARNLTECAPTRPTPRRGEGTPPITQPRTFTLCADDYALAPGVSRGIREALDGGALSAASAMTNGPAWPQEAAALRRFRERGDLGLHLTLTCGRPLTAMPYLAPKGELPPLGVLMRRLRSGAAAAGELDAEIDAQLGAFADAMAMPPDHVDGHQHVHVLPPVRRALLAALRRRGWWPWLRDSADAPGRILRRRSAPVKALAVALLARDFRRDAETAGLDTNVGFAGFSRFAADDAYATDFARYLIAPGPRHLVMCHPGYVDETLRRLDPVVETRERELRFLLSPAFGALLARHVMEPARMRRGRPSP